MLTTSMNTYRQFTSSHLFIPIVVTANRPNYLEIYTLKRKRESAGIRRELSNYDQTKEYAVNGILSYLRRYAGHRRTLADFSGFMYHAILRSSRGIQNEQGRTVNAYLWLAGNDFSCNKLSCYRLIKVKYTLESSLRKNYFRS